MIYNKHRLSVHDYQAQLCKICDRPFKNLHSVRVHANQSHVHQVENTGNIQDLFVPIPDYAMNKHFKN